jgi:predicted ATP-dependent protease
VLFQPFAWEELKRVLRAREIRIESLAQTLSMISTVTLEPEPVPLQVKVVLVGDRLLYYLLCALDPDFSECPSARTAGGNTMPKRSTRSLSWRSPTTMLPPVQLGGKPSPTT